jgi:hypothetical protein
MSVADQKANWESLYDFSSVSGGVIRIFLVRAISRRRVIALEGISTGVICELPVSSLKMKYLLISILIAASASQRTHF